MFNKTLEQTLNRVFSYAQEKNHEFITVEHLLLGLLDNPDIDKILTACGADVAHLRSDLGVFIEETTPQSPPDSEHIIQPTVSFQRVLQRAIYEVQCNGNLEVGAANVLMAIFSEPESQAVYFLRQENINRVDIINYTTQGTSKPRIETRFIQEPTQMPEGHGNLRENALDENLIELYAVNLNARARNNRTDPLIGRQEEMLRCVQILCRRTKNNPLLVGEAGVGKTAIVEGLAQLLVQRKVPKALSQATIYSLDLGILLAGTKYRGDFEKRFKAILKALSREPHAIVFIDEIHNLVGAGSATGGTMDASNLIKPLLTTGELRCMGATTYEEYRNFFSKDHALLRRFQKIDVREPTCEETIHILHGLKSRYETFHHTRYTTSALKRAVELSDRYIVDRHLPDKAIDVIDEAGAYQNLQSASPEKGVVTDKEIEAVVAKIARIPVEKVVHEEQELLSTLPHKLKQVIFGQEQGIDILANAIKLARLGLHDINKPVGSFLLVGPTGVGKTEVSKQLAEILGIEFLRFDMSEYMERHTVSRLIGAPPGYVGYDQGGLLTEAVRKHPHAVLLLDEIEKAHPELFNILLQVMDYGHLTDNNGRQADFRYIVLMMTTNAGMEILERGNIGFVKNDSERESLSAVKRFFSPEFRNRLDAVVPFGYLPVEAVLQVVDKFMKTLHAQLKEKKIQLSINPTVKEWLAKHGYHETLGARPIARFIQEKIKMPIAEALIGGQLLEEGEVWIDVEKEDIRLHYRTPKGIKKYKNVDLI